jgi:hypothetical protein
VLPFPSVAVTVQEYVLLNVVQLTEPVYALPPAGASVDV